MDVLDGAARGVEGEALDEQGGREDGDVQECGLVLADDGGFDGLGGLLDVDAVVLPQVVVEVARFEFRRAERGADEVGRDVQVLDGHGGAVDEAEPGDVEQLGGG